MHRLTVLLALAACALRPHDFDASATATDGTTTTAPAPDLTTGPAPTTDGTTTTTPATTTGDATTGSTGSTSWSFIQPKDGGSPGKECDQWVQDCPEGEKCMPYSGDGDNAWESLKCVPIVRDPAGLYEPCTVIGSAASGEDTCDEGLMCWNVDPDTGTGTCHGMCTGSPETPGCADPDATCLLSSEGVLTLCFPHCDPLTQDCPGGDLCIYNPADSSFFCILDASGDEGQTFDPCEYISTCDAGLSCANPALATECDQMAGGCCLPFCDLTGWTCPGKDQTCLPWFEEGQAPPKYENVGVCGLPQ